MISVIIINYNTHQLTLDCIASIIQNEPNKSIEFIIVDNASKSEDYQKLESGLKAFDSVILVRSKINLGFAAGNMLGYQHATGEFSAFINSDVIFIEPVFDLLSDFMYKTPEAGVCGPQILDGNRKESISFRPFEGLRYKMLGKKFLEFTAPQKPSMRKKYNAPIAVDFVLGSFMFFRTAAFNAIGGFDINTFLYYEETDVCYRLKKAGYKTYFYPYAKYIHLEGQSSTPNLNLKLEHHLSYLYVTRKNFGFLKYFILKNYLILTYLLKAPFKKKNRFIFNHLCFSGDCLAVSMRHKQTIQN